MSSFSLSWSDLGTAQPQLVPVSVKLAQQPQSKRNMRSSAPVIPAIPDIQPDTVQLGNFFALKSESEDGLLVVQCTQILGNQFNGNVLKKVSDETINVLYKLEDNVETFLKSSVLTRLCQ